MAKEFNIGDIVFLKSGSPAMTVRKYNSYLDGMKEKESEVELTCTWADSNEMKSQTFHQDMLTKEDPN